MTFCHCDMSLLSGIFPQDEYPEDVSTDEDDEMFGSRKRMKRRGGNMEEDEEGTPAAKTCKGNTDGEIYLQLMTSLKMCHGILACDNILRMVFRSLMPS